MNKLTITITEPKNCYECPFNWGDKFCNLDKEYRELSKEIPTWCHLKTTNEIIPVKWLISKSYDFLIERQITGTEMNFIINLINIWREENDSK